MQLSKLTFIVLMLLLSIKNNHLQAQSPERNRRDNGNASSNPDTTETEKDSIPVLHKDYYANFSLGSNFDLIDGVTLNNAYAELRAKIPITNKKYCKFRLYAGIYLNRNISVDSAAQNRAIVGINPLLAGTHPTDSFVNVEYRYSKLSRVTFRSENLGLYLNPAYVLYDNREDKSTNKKRKVYSCLHLLVHYEMIRRSYRYEHQTSDLSTDTIRQSLGEPILNSAGQLSSKIRTQGIPEFYSGSYWDFYFGLGFRYEANWKPISIFVQPTYGYAYLNGINRSSGLAPLLEPVSKAYYNVQFSIRENALAMRVGGEVRGIWGASGFPHYSSPFFVLFIAQDISLDKLYKRFKSPQD